jgi:hypothetical protein
MTTQAPGYICILRLQYHAPALPSIDQCSWRQGGSQELPLLAPATRLQGSAAPTSHSTGHSRPTRATCLPLAALRPSCGPAGAAQHLQKSYRIHGRIRAFVCS